VETKRCWVRDVVSQNYWLWSRIVCTVL